MEKSKSNILLLFLFLASAIFGYSFFRPSNVPAQSCTGSYTCCNDPLIWECPEGDKDPVTGECLGNLQPVCKTGSFQKTCEPYFSVCTYLGTCNIISGSCSAASPPPPPPSTPPPGWQGCGSCNTCGHPGECVTSPEGVCLWDPASCSTSPPPAGTCEVRMPLTLSLERGDTPTRVNPRIIGNGVTFKSADLKRNDPFRVAQFRKAIGGDWASSQHWNEDQLKNIPTGQGRGEFFIRGVVAGVNTITMSVDADGVQCSGNKTTVVTVEDSAWFQARDGEVITSNC